MTHPMSFRGVPFNVIEGSTHPAYSLNCFSETEDEGAFREKFWHPQPGQFVVDVGASYGAYSLSAAACGARVLAFEPEPTVRVDLERNVALNPGFDVKVSGDALWSERTTINMRTIAPHWPAQTITQPYYATTLDAYELERCDWLKVDVEGCEAEVLTGSTQTLQRCRPVVIVEVHVFMSNKLLPLCRDLLKVAGYDEFETVDRDPCVILIGRAKQ